MESGASVRAALAGGVFWEERWGLTRCFFPFQFAVLMWVFTYVGALFNGLTLLILGECWQPRAGPAVPITLPEPRGPSRVLGSAASCRGCVSLF